jgi:hypothetical protein
VANHPSLWWFFNKVKRLWLASLKRRSQTARLSWEKFIRLITRFFPPIRVCPQSSDWIAELSEHEAD